MVGNSAFLTCFCSFMGIKTSKSFCLHLLKVECVVPVWGASVKAFNALSAAWRNTGQVLRESCNMIDFSAGKLYCIKWPAEQQSRWWVSVCIPVLNLLLECFFERLLLYRSLEILVRRAPSLCPRAGLYSRTSLSARRLSSCNSVLAEIQGITSQEIFGFF